MTLSQILSGSIFGDHSSPLSDTTLLSSVASQCDLFAHVNTQLPYAVWVAIFSILCGTLMVGNGTNAGICLFVGFIVITICSWLVAAPVIAKNGRFDIFTELYLIYLKKRDKKEHDLLELKSKTVLFVQRGEKEDPDLLLRFLRLLPWTKCGIKVFEDNSNSEKMDNYGSLAMSNHVPNESIADIEGAGDKNTNTSKIVEQEREEEDDKLL